jgi:hypothetical protein
LEEWKVTRTGAPNNFRPTDAFKLFCASSVDLKLIVADPPVGMSTLSAEGKTT